MTAAEPPRHLHPVVSPPTSMMNDIPGSIIITTIAMLTSPQSVDPSKGPRNKVFHASLNVNDGRETSTLGLLRYFVPEELMPTVEAMQDFTQAFVIATICAMPPNGPPDLSIAMNDVDCWTDYAFIGDIVKVITLSATSTPFLHFSHHS